MKDTPEKREFLRQRYPEMNLDRAMAETQKKLDRATSLLEVSDDAPLSDQVAELRSLAVRMCVSLVDLADALDDALGQNRDLRKELKSLRSDHDDLDRSSGRQQSKTRQDMADLNIRFMDLAKAVVPNELHPIHVALKARLGEKPLNPDPDTEESE